jgi:hypothetical protein
MTREQLYTTVSRGRTANHLYIAVGDGEPHRILHTDIQEPTATDILQRVMSRTSLPVYWSSGRPRRVVARRQTYCEFRTASTTRVVKLQPE